MHDLEVQTRYATKLPPVFMSLDFSDGLTAGGTGGLTVETGECEQPKRARTRDIRNALRIQDISMR